MSIAECASNILELMNRSAGDDRNSPDHSWQVREAAGGAHLSAASDHLPQALGEPHRVFATVATPMITTLVAFRSAAPVHNTILGYITTMLNGKIVL